MPTLPFSWTAKGLGLTVRLTSRASRSGLGGIVTRADGKPMLQIRVAAPPVEGVANAALIALLADALHIRKSHVTIVSSENARVKRLDIAGDPAAICARIEAWMLEENSN